VLHCCSTPQEFAAGHVEGAVNIPFMLSQPEGAPCASRHVKAAAAAVLGASKHSSALLLQAAPSVPWHHGNAPADAAFAGCLLPLQVLALHGWRLHRQRALRFTLQQQVPDAAAVLPWLACHMSAQLRPVCSGFAVLLLLYLAPFPLLLLPGMVPNAEFVQQVKQQFPNQEQLLVMVSAAAHDMAVRTWQHMLGNHLHTLLEADGHLCKQLA
jgi:hypothetical protein